MGQSARNLDEEYNEQNSFKVYIHTLAPHTANGPGIYAMNSLKSMTGKESFKQLPDSLKKCHVQNREDCQTNKFLEQVKDNCNCTAWPLITDYSKSKVIMQNVTKYFDPNPYSNRHLDFVGLKVRSVLQGKI